MNGRLNNMQRNLITANLGFLPRKSGTTLDILPRHFEDTIGIINSACEFT